MISLKDVTFIITILGTAIPGGIYVHDTKRDVVELGRDYRQHIIDSQRYETQKAIWQYQDRLKEHPKDTTTKERLRQLEYEQQLLEYKQKLLKKEEKDK